MTLILLIFAALGLTISGFFALVIYGKVEPDARFIPKVCRMERGSCTTVLGHPDARLFGVPNALVGIAFYLIVAATALSGRGNFLRQIAVIAAWIAVTSGMYLTWSLLAKIRISCVLCFTSHALNLLIAILLVIKEVWP